MGTHDLNIQCLFLVWLISFYSGLLAFHDLKFISSGINAAVQLSLCMMLVILSLQLQSTCTFDSDVSFLQAAYHCVFLLILLFVFKIHMCILVIKTNSANLMLFGFCSFYQSQSFSKNFHFIFICMGIYYAYTACVCLMPTQTRRECRHREPLCGCWELNWKQ